MDKTCRICLIKGTAMSNIYETKNSYTLASKLFSLTKIEMHPGDGLPYVICLDCIKKLDICEGFIQQCINSDLILRDELANVNNLVDSDTFLNHISFDDEDLSMNEHIQSPKCHINSDLKLEKNVGDKGYDNVECKMEKEDKIANDNKSKKQQCFTCGKVMSSRFRLKTHLRTHTGERPHSCPHCNKKFSLKQNLQVHIRIHTGEKPLECEECGATFAQSAGLAAHRRKHTGITPYTCTLCPRTFRTIGHLQYHIRRHTGEKNFECDICSRAFITRSDLKQHARTHSGERPHVCSVCGLCLTRASHLKRHILHAHNGKKPLICTECPSEFTNKKQFENHKRVHEKNIDDLEVT